MGGHERDMYTLMVEEDEQSYSPHKHKHADSSRRHTCCTRRPLFAAACMLLIASIFSTFAIYSRVELHRPDLVLEEQDPQVVKLEIEFIVPELEVDAVPSATNDGWTLFDASAPALPEAERPADKERPTLGQTFFSPPGCLESWIAQGTLCPALITTNLTPASETARLLDQLKLSIVHTWVNGSDARLSAIKEDVYAATKATVVKGNKFTATAKPGDAGRHFRQHGELVHSMRSAVKALGRDAIDGFHLVTTDLPLPALSLAELDEDEDEDEDEGSSLEARGDERMGQIPTWLNLDAEACAGGPGVQMHHHWDLFKMRAAEAAETERAREEQEKAAGVWRDAVLPSFNSIGIETQLVTLASKMRDTFLYFNDDFFTTRPLAPTDFSSPLFGTVLRMQYNPSVSSTPKGMSKQDADGEWPSLGYANWLVDQRFSAGGRRRGYLQHFVKSYSAPLLAEVAQVWGEELTEAAGVRFRGAGHGSAPGLAFLAANYVIERHREALLWSYLVARSSSPAAGTYAPAQRRAILADLGYRPADNATTLIIQEPVRAPALTAPQALAAAGLPPPRGTHYAFAAHESGYAYAWFDGRPVLKGGAYTTAKPITAHNSGWPDYRPGANAHAQIACVLDLVECFGADFVGGGEGAAGVGVQATMRRVAFEKPKCGDCVIARLLAKSGERGLEAFLPPPGAGPASAAGGAGVALSMAKTWQDAVYENVGGRARALSLLQRYSYVIGDSAAEFITVTSSRGLVRHIKNLEAAMARTDGGEPAFVVLNDDVSDRASAGEFETVDKLMTGWMHDTWPEKMCWEL